MNLNHSFIFLLRLRVYCLLGLKPVISLLKEHLTRPLPCGPKMRRYVSKISPAIVYLSFSILYV